MALLDNSKTSHLRFNVTNAKPELIVPASATPYGFKRLSVIDNQHQFGKLVPGIHFYRSGPIPGTGVGPDPVKVIKEGISKALVSYYPLAGRLRETDDGELVVECNAQGILFVEGRTDDVALVDFGDPLYPPFPCMQELFHDFDNNRVVDFPLFLIQVTRLKCGGFICAHKINHKLVDGTGFTQFLNAVAELARGAEVPSITPVWDRHLLRARNPPRVTYKHREYDQLDDIHDTITVINKSFFFGPKEIEAIRRFLPTDLKSSTGFEVLVACIWRCRTVAMQIDPNDEVRLRIIVNARAKFNSPLPIGYYGNVLATPVAISTAKNLVSNPLGYALALIKSAKSTVTEDYMKSLIDFTVTKGRPKVCHVRTYTVSNVSRVKVDLLDFGWGEPVYGGPVYGCLTLPSVGNYFIAGKNEKGESGIIVPISLSRLDMERFIRELNMYMGDSDNVKESGRGRMGLTKSSL